MTRIALALAFCAIAALPRFASADDAPPATLEPAAVPGAAPTAESQGESFKEFGRIDTELKQVRRPNCWGLILRGRLTNPYNEAVEGIRLIVRLRGDGESPREIERIETNLRISIGPHAAARFDREIDTGCTTSFTDISVVAFANRRGEIDLPTPTLEVEIAAGKVEAASSSGGNVSALGNVGTWGVGFR
jgi:hypothetical protein